jgi:hypothetical protein
MPTSKASAKAAKHQSVQALLDAHPGERWPKKIIKKLAIERLADARRKGWKGPPFCPKELASLYGIICREVRHDIGGDGRILPDPRRPKLALIEYRAGQMEERQRFTMFHEFAHTLFPDYCELKTYHQDADAKDPNKEFENLCDAAAAEFMMPVDEFAAYIKGKKIGGILIQELRTRYRASIDATVRRVIDLTASVAVGAVFLLAANGGKREVLYSLKSTLFKSYYPRGTKVGWNGANNAPQEATLYFDNFPRTYLVEALPLPIIPENPNYPTTLLLLQPAGTKNRTRIV